MKSSTESISGKSKLVVALILLIAAVGGVGMLMLSEVPLKQQKVEKVIINESVIH